MREERAHKLLQVKEVWNPAFLARGKLYVSNTYERLQRVRALPRGRVLPCVSKGDGGAEEAWVWRGWWRLESVIFKRDDKAAIVTECGKRGSRKSGPNFDVGAVVTFAQVDSPLPPIEASTHKNATPAPSAVKHTPSKMRLGKPQMLSRAEYLYIVWGGGLWAGLWRGGLVRRIERFDTKTAI